MGVTLTEREAWDRLNAGHTGILTTLRRDGWPVSLPTWFVVLEGRIYARARRASEKVTRVHRDPRAAFLVESGSAWAELAAVMVYGTVSVLEDGDEAAFAVAAIDGKYAGFRPDDRLLPTATRRHYGDRVILRLEPTGQMITWDNSRIRLPS